MKPPAEPGMGIDEVDTPALIVDLDAFERNCRGMAAVVAGGRVRLRPHAKTHKCPAIARRQVALGAVGVCCQKVSEAAAMVEGGIADVLISNEVVGAVKLRQLAALAREADVAVCADDPGNVDDLDAAAALFGVRLRVLVEIDVGSNRCGVRPGSEAVALAEHIAGKRHLEFAGLQAYYGAAQHMRAEADRRAATGRAVEMTGETIALLQAKGLDCAIVGGAGTGTFRFEQASGVYNELQPGSYVFMDADYARNLDSSGRNAPEFEQSLFVLATVMSAAAPGRAVLDAGLKAFSVDSGLPLVADRPGLMLRKASDEHGTLETGDARLRVGERVRLIPGHCDPTVNLHDWLVACRNGVVEALWPIAARGAVY